MLLRESSNGSYQRELHHADKNVRSHARPRRTLVSHPVSICQAPEVKLRGSDKADNVEVDICRDNHIHHNTFRTYGNECVDFKEGSTANVFEHNVCEKQMDENSGCVGSRGSGNTIRFNEIADCVGACVRVGGDKGYGEDNHIYENHMKNCEYGAFNVMAENQGTVCHNQLSGISPSVSVGSQDHNQDQFLEENATGACSSYPGPDWATIDEPADSKDSTSATETSESGDDGSGDDGSVEYVYALSEDHDDDISAGINYADGVESTSEIVSIETNSLAGTSGIGGCRGSVASIRQAKIHHPAYQDPSTDVSNLFDGTLDTYFSVHRESTKFEFELDEATEVDSVNIAFFMKDPAEERIQTFTVSVKEGAEDDDDEPEWVDVVSRSESDGSQEPQNFAFSSRANTRYVRFETHGNTFNNWSAVVGFEVCGAAQEESNALFSGMKDIGKELELLDGALCAEPDLLTLKEVQAVGGDENNISVLFDGNFDSRWSTQNTQNPDDMDNDRIIMTLAGDTRVSSVSISFFDGNLAQQKFSIYKESAADYHWTPVMLDVEAALETVMQSFEINSDKVARLYIIGKGNYVGSYSKISEIKVYGC